MSRPRTGPTQPNTPPDADSVSFDVTVDVTDRLDRFLADQLAFSRTVAGRLIGDGAVTVNGAVARPSRRLQRGDRVEVKLPHRQPRRTLRPHPVPLEVVYEDEALLVINKPAGLVVHPAPGHWDDTLVNALLARGISLSDQAPGRPGIVHRLDRDTSGLMLVAKADDAHRKLARALAARRIERRYAALSWGHLRTPVTVDAPIARHPRDRKRMAVLATGRPARSEFESVARFEVCDLVRVRLSSGRTHQIRVHLAHCGHPVVGDRVYGGGGSRRVAGQQRQAAAALERAAPRQALHAALLALEHPVTRERLEFRAEWPADLQRALGTAAGDPQLLARPQALHYLGFFK